jgi:nucleoside-diphosphate-sugar epimerase
MNWENKHVLVTGATGFIGSHLVKRLVKEGAHVSALLMSECDPGSIADLFEHIKIIKADIADVVSLHTALALEKPEIVFHLAACVDVRRDWECVSLMIENNLVGTANLLHVLKDRQIDLMINIGSSEEYGDASSPQFETNRELPVSPYSFSKVAAVYLCQMAARVFNFPVVTARLFPVYGPGQNTGMFIPSAIIKLLNREEFRMSPGEQIREFNYVDDVVEALIRLSASDDNIIGSVINVGNGIPYKIIEVIDTIKGLIDDNACIQVGALPYRVGEVMESYCDNSLLKRLTGWEPQFSLEEGLRLTVQGYRNELPAREGSNNC